MSDQAMRLCRHIEVHKALRKVQAKNDPAAGLAITICVGPSDAENAQSVELEICHDTQVVLDAVVQAHRETMATSANLARGTARDLGEAVARYVEYTTHIDKQPAR